MDTPEAVKRFKAMAQDIEKQPQAVSASPLLQGHLPETVVPQLSSHEESSRSSRKRNLRALIEKRRAAGALEHTENVIPSSYGKSIKNKHSARTRTGRAVFASLQDSFCRGL
jgi:hypothetical protein